MPIFNFKQGDAVQTDGGYLGTVLQVDTRRVSISAEDEHLMRASIGKLVALRRGTVDDWLIGMVDRIVRQIVTADARPSAGGGSYSLQLTASRSEAEARALWRKVSRKNPALASKQPNIEKTDIGSLGTFYRLQIGPFQNKAESLKLCDTLKRGGVDCFLVTQ